MNDETRPAAPNLFIPFLVLAISFATLLIYQIVNVNKQHNSMEATQKQLAEVITQRNDLVKQSVDVQNKLQTMAIDLLALSQNNEKAKAIVQKYNIQQTGAPGVPAAPAAPSPAPAGQ